MNSRLLQLAAHTLRIAPVCLLLALAGCRRTEPPAPVGGNSAPAANADAVPPSYGAAPCGVPYYPVREGLEKHYRVSYERDATPPASYAESHANVAVGSFTLRYSLAGLTVDTVWYCAPEGMIALDYGKLDSARQAGGLRMETLAREGISVPAADRWRVGESWESRYEIRTELAGQGASGRGAGAVEITNRVVARESVTVPAGTYDALKVESALALKMTVRVGQMAVPTGTNARSTVWFAEGVGMIKSLSAGDFGGATTELVSLKQ